MAVQFVTSTVLRAVNKASAPMRKMAMDAQKLKRQFRGAQKAADGLQKSGKKLTGGFSVPVALGFAGIVRQASSFEDAMTGVAKQLPDSAGANGLSAIKSQIIGISKTANQTPQQIAAIAEEAGKASVPFENWGKFISLTSKAAAALDMEAGVAAEALLGIGAGLGIRNDLAALQQFAADSNMVADSAKATAPELLDFAKRVSGIARIAGASSDKVLAIGGAFIDTGVESEIAARATSKLFTVLGTSEGITKKAQSAFSRLKLPKDFVKQFRSDAPTAIKLLSEKLQNLDEDAKLGVLKNAFGEDQSKNIARLLSNVGKMTELVQKVGDKSKSAAKFDDEYSKQLAKFSSQWQMLKNNISAFSIEIGETLLPVLKDVFNKIKPFIQSTVSWIKENKKATTTILSIVAAVAVLGPVLFAVGSAVSGVIAVTKGLILLSSAVKIAAISAKMFAVVLAANPIGLVIAAVAALAAGFAYLVHKTGGVKEAFVAIGNFLLKFTPFGLLAKTIYDNWGGISDFFKGVFEGIKSYFSKGVLFILKKIKSVSDALNFVIPDSVINSLDAKIAKFENIASGDLKVASDLAKPRFYEFPGSGGTDKIDTEINIKVEGAAVLKTSSSTKATKRAGTNIGNIGTNILPQQ
ncbi:MAG: phage tail tape measure protein [Arenicella sp.]